MRRSVVGAILVAVVAVAAGERVAAQETGTPDFKAPYRAFDNHEFGATVSFPEGADFGLEGYYTYGYRRFDVGLRGGILTVDTPIDDDTQILLGGSFRARVIEATERFPLDGALTLGAGLSIGDGPDIFRIPVGVSLGRRFLIEGSRVTFVPFVHPVLVPRFGGGDDEVDFAFGLGVDIAFSRQFQFRVSGGVGDVEGISLGAAFIR